MGTGIGITGPSGAGGGSSSAPSGAKLMKTGADPFIVGDDGNTQRGRLVDWFTLVNVPVHADGSATMNTTTFRFTDEFGGQTFTTGIILDWSTWDWTNINMWQDDFQLSAFTTLALATAICTAFTLGGFSGWEMPNFDELNSVVQKKFDAFDYVPFSDTAVSILWTNTALSAGVASVFRYDNFDFSKPSVVANSAKPFPIRIGTVIGTTLS